jgi:hypothetical protein
VNYSYRSPKGNRPMRRLLNQAANAAVRQKEASSRFSIAAMCRARGHRSDCPSAFRLIWKILHQVRYEERAQR